MDPASTWGMVVVSFGFAWMVGCGGHTTASRDEPAGDVARGGAASEEREVPAEAHGGAATEERLLSTEELCDAGILVSITVEPPPFCAAHGLACGTPCDPCWDGAVDCSPTSARYRCDRFGSCVDTRY